MLRTNLMNILANNAPAGFDINALVGTASVSEEEDNSIPSSTFPTTFSTFSTTTAMPIRIRMPKSKFEILHIERPDKVQEVTMERVTLSPRQQGTNTIKCEILGHVHIISLFICQLL